MSTQISERCGGGDSGRQMNPVVVSELLSGAGLCAKGEALLAGDLGSNAVEVTEGGSIGRPEDLLVIFPKGYDHEVVSQRPGDGSEGSHLLGPWGKKERQLNHAKGATLWNAAWVVVGEAQSSSKGVVI